MGELLTLPPPRRTPPDLFPIRSLDEIRQMPREEFLVSGLIPRQGFGVLYGASGSFKSFLALDLAFAVATGREWSGRDVKHGPVVVIAAEGASGVSKRVAGILDANPSIPDGAPFTLVPACPNLGTPKGDLQRLIASIENVGIAPALIVVDTLAQVLHGADENGAGMTAFIRNAQALASHFGCFVLALHHIGHQHEGRLRGHSSLPAACDLIMRMDRLPDGASATIGVEKLKDGSRDLMLTATLRRVTLTGGDGEPSTTLVVDSITEGVEPRTERRARAAQSKLSGGAKLALDALRAAVARHGVESPGSEHIPAGALVVDLDQWREQAYAASSAEPEARKKAFKRSCDKLLELRKVGLHEGQAWVA